MKVGLIFNIFLIKICSIGHPKLAKYNLFAQTHMFLQTFYLCLLSSKYRLPTICMVCNDLAVYGQFGMPYWKDFQQNFTQNLSKLIQIYTKACFLMYNGPWDVSEIVNRTSDINFALGISLNDHTNIGKFIFRQFSTIPDKMFKMCINKLAKGTIDQISIKT